MAEEVQALLVNMDQFYAGPITPTGHCNPSPLMLAFAFGTCSQVSGTNRLPFVFTWMP